MLPQATTSDEKRFWSKVIEDESGCWLWQGGRAHGYGTFGISGKTVRAHRIAYLWAHGTIPDGLEICHHCDVRNCVRPDHLFAGTRSDNMWDMSNKGRNAMQRHPERSALRRGYRQVCGSEQGSAKLTEADAAEMRERAARGESAASLGRAFNVHASTAWRVIHWRRYVMVQP